MSGLAWRLLGRELRSGELRLLLAALVVAVAAVTAVGFFTDRVRLALEHEAHQLIGGDLLLVTDHPWPAAVRDEAARRGLQTAETVTFPSMVLANGQAQLADIKAVSTTYPLRGSLRQAQQPGQTGEMTRHGPPAGAVWLDERLSAALQAAVEAPSFIAAMAQVGVVPATASQATPAALAGQLEREIARWRPMIVRAGQYAD